jgi:hypothetical protein
MHVPNSHGRPRHRWRPRFATTLMFAFTAFAGMAQAVEFDERVRAPMMKDAAELKSQAQDFSARFAAIRETAPERLVLDAALAREQFDIAWKAKRAVDERRPLGELAAVGIVSDINGVVRIDFNAYPQWQPYEERLAILFAEANMQGLREELMHRGFRANDFAALEAYLATHDLSLAAAERALPVALGFNKIVRKYDKLKRPVDTGLVLSYVYQQAKIRAEVTREWSAGLLQTLDAQRSRILFDYVSEPESFGVWTPTVQHDALAEILAMMRRPDFEQQAIAEARGAQP